MSFTHLLVYQLHLRLHLPLTIALSGGRGNAIASTSPQSYTALSSANIGTYGSGHVRFTLVNNAWTYGYMMYTISLIDIYDSKYTDDATTKSAIFSTQGSCVLAAPAKYYTYSNNKTNQLNPPVAGNATVFQDGCSGKIGYGGILYIIPYYSLTDGGHCIEMSASGAIGPYNMTNISQAYGTVSCHIAAYIALYADS